MAKELMQIEIDSGLKKEFLECINHAYKEKQKKASLTSFASTLNAPKDLRVRKKSRAKFSSLFLRATPRAALLLWKSKSWSSIRRMRILKQLVWIKANNAD